MPRTPGRGPCSVLFSVFGGHLAAHAGVRFSIHDPLGYQFTNVTGTIRLLDHCRKMGTPHFVFASSSSVYGPDTPPPMSLVRFALDDQSS